MQDRINELQFQSMKREIREILEIIDRPFLEKFHNEFLSLYQKVLQLRANEDRLVNRYNETKRHVEQKFRVLRVRNKEKTRNEAKPMELESLKSTLDSELEKVQRENEIATQKLNMEEENLRKMRTEYQSLQNEHEDAIIKIRNLKARNELKKKDLKKKNINLRNLLLRCNNYRKEKEKKNVRIERQILSGMKKKEELRDLEQFLKTEKMNLQEIRARSTNIENRTRLTIEKLQRERMTRDRKVEILGEKRRKNVERVSTLEDRQKKLQEYQKKLESKHRDLMKCENSNIQMEEKKRLIELEKEMTLRKIESKRNSAISLEHQCDLMTTAIEDTKKQNELVDKNLSLERKKVSKLKADVEFFEALKEKTAQKISNLSYQRKALNSQLSGSVNYEKRKEEILKLMSREISKTRNEIESCRISAHTKRMKNYQIRKEVKMYRLQLDEIKNKKKDVEIKHSLHKSKREYLESKIDILRKDIEKIVAENEKMEKKKSEISNVVVRKSSDLKKLKSSVQLLYTEIASNKERASRYDKDIIQERNNVWKEKAIGAEIIESVEMLEKKIEEREKEFEKMVGEANEKKKLFEESVGLIQNESSDIKKLLDDRLLLNKRLTQSSQILINIQSELNEQSLKRKFGTIEYNRFCREIRSFQLRINHLTEKIESFRSKYDSNNHLSIRKKINNKKRVVSEKQNLLSIIEQEKEKKMNLQVSHLRDEEHKQLISKYQSYKKSLINKTVKISETNKKIEEKETLYKELRSIMKNARYQQSSRKMSREDMNDDSFQNDEFLTSDKLKIFESTLKKKISENEKLKRKLVRVRDEKDIQEQDSRFLRRRLSLLENKLVKKKEEREKKKKTRSRSWSSGTKTDFSVSTAPEVTQEMTCHEKVEEIVDRMVKRGDGDDFN